MWYARDIIMAMQFARANLNHLRHRQLGIFFRLTTRAMG